MYSTVTGKMLTEIDAAGQKIETHVSAFNTEFRQIKAYAIKTSSTQFTNYPEQIVQEYSDPKGTRAYQWDRQTNTSKYVHMSPAGVANLAIDWADLKNRFVSNIAGQMAYAQAQSRYPGTRSQLEDPTNPGRGCELDGKSTSCGKVRRGLASGAYDFDPHQQQDEKALWEAGIHSHQQQVSLTIGGTRTIWTDTFIDSDGSQGINLNELDVSIDGGGGKEVPPSACQLWVESMTEYTFKF